MLKKYVKSQKWRIALWNFNRCHASNVTEDEKRFGPLAFRVRHYHAPMNSKDYLSNFDGRIM